ncbi:MAG: UPF0182 family protein [Firmicutes bacterium]|nr:UPF0182 family protein [Bacillota bacterium]
MKKISRLLLILLAVVVLGIWSVSGKYLDWLWFKSLGPATVFWVSLLTGPVVKLVVGIIVFVFLAINFLIAIRAFDRIRSVDSSYANFSSAQIRAMGWLASAGLAFIIALTLSLDWTVIQQFLHPVKTGTPDPVFNLDLGYYLFTFPFYQQLNSLMLSITFLGLAGTGVIYFMAKAFYRHGRSWELWPQAKAHLSILAILFLGVKIWGYGLGKYGLLFQESARLTGINYTAEHARMFGLSALSVILIAVIAAILIGLFRRGSKILIGGLILWMAASVILMGIYPAALQAVKVTPNEYEMEKPYLEKHIQWTRQAYGLDKIKSQNFIPRDDKSVLLNPKDPALTDLRLWDYRPLIPSYNQLQAIGPYYEFNDVDIDRYPSATGQRQVMLGARELKISKLPEQAHGWINLNLTYTHGYGIAANQVTQYSSQGQPVFIAKNMPPEAAPEFPALTVTQPEIYFGEATDHYVVVNTRTREYNPLDGQDGAGEYRGPKGVPVTPFTKILMAFKYQEYNFLLSSQLTKDSSILLNRNIMRRVQKLAPFLFFDEDPYLVVSGGEIYWIIDAYTYSAYYPYAKRYEGGINYLRNSVKAVVNAYSGEVNFYIADYSDPILAVWRKVFPHLFKAVAPADLVRHFRYPEYLMTVQRDLLLQYHMTDPKDFYEREDAWDVPTENQDGQEQIFHPYYVTMKLPGEKNAEFVMMQPFSPRSKQNLTSWLIARCDQPNYGELLLYNLPRDRNIYGPSQIDSRINQDQTISQLVTLWNQQQSQVRWGNLLIVPLEGAILYVKPLFLESGRGRQAELKRVVVVYQDQVLIGETVAGALENFATNLPTRISSLPVDRDEEERLKRKEELIKRWEESIKEQQRLLKEFMKL